MEYGYILPHYSKFTPLEKMIKKIKILEKNNKFSSIWITDHILLPKGTKLRIYESFNEAIVTASYLASITSLDIGFSTIVLPTRHPILLAKQLATLDYFIPERLRISFGAGWSEDEFQNLDQNYSNRGKRFNDGLMLIKALFRGDNQFSGEFYSYSNSILSPRSVTLSKLPILIAGNSKAAVSRAKRHGDGWHPGITGAKGLVDLLDNNQYAIEKIIPRLSLSSTDTIKEIDKLTDMGIRSIVIGDGNNEEVFDQLLEVL